MEYEGKGKRGLVGEGKESSMGGSERGEQEGKGREWSMKGKGEMRIDLAKWRENQLISGK